MPLFVADMRILQRRRSGASRDDARGDNDNSNGDTVSSEDLGACNSSVLVVENDDRHDDDDDDDDDDDTRGDVDTDDANARCTPLRAKMEFDAVRFDIEDFDDDSENEERASPIIIRYVNRGSESCCIGYESPCVR